MLSSAAALSSTLDDSSTSLSSGASRSTRSSIGPHSASSPLIKRGGGEGGPADVDGRCRRSKSSSSSSGSPLPIAPSSTPRADALNRGLRRQSTDESVGAELLRAESGGEVTTTASSHSSTVTSSTDDETALELTKAPLAKEDRRRRAGVRWGTVEIHSHAITLGDNVCSCGPPVTIGWTAFDTTVVEVDSYESHKPESRHKGEMLLPAWVREDMLREAGYPRSRVQEASQSVAETKQQRLKSSRDGRFRESLVAILKGGKAGAARRRQRRTSNSYGTPSPSTASKGLDEDTAR